MRLYIVTVIFFASSSLSDKVYRQDYVYNRKTDAFYKLHTESEIFRRANAMCHTEGASLMIPSDQRDVTQVHGMLKQFPDIGNLVWVGNDGNIHEPAEEHLNIPLVYDMIDDLQFSCDVITREGGVETAPCFQRIPFICKVKAKDAPYDSRCGVHSRDYEYFENVGSCYKIPQAVYSWDQAYDECSAEGAHLVVLNSDLERQVVRNITLLAPHLGYAPWYFFAGFRAEKTFDGSPRVFKTIFGETLKEAGFDEWAENEPNNAQGKEYCGSIFRRNGKYNDVNCSHLYGFICEKEVPTRH